MTSQEKALELYPPTPGERIKFGIHEHIDINQELRDAYMAGYIQCTIDVQEYDPDECY